MTKQKQSGRDSSAKSSGSRSGGMTDSGDGWKEIEPIEEEVWQPSAKGETVVGKLAGIRLVNTKYGERMLCEILTSDARVTVWCPTRLRALLEQVAEFPGPGCDIRIRYEGQDKPGSSGRQGAHNFAVAVRGGGARPAE